MPAAHVRPFRPGTVLECAGVQARVTRDTGFGAVELDCSGFVQHWEWDAADSQCKVVSVPRGRLFYDSFEDYVADFPEAEHLRAWLTNLGHQEVHLLRLRTCRITALRTGDWSEITCLCRSRSTAAGLCLLRTIATTD